MFFLPFQFVSPFPLPDFDVHIHKFLKQKLLAEAFNNDMHVWYTHIVFDCTWVEGELSFVRRCRLEGTFARLHLFSNQTLEEVLSPRARCIVYTAMLQTVYVPLSNLMRSHPETYATAWWRSNSIPPLKEVSPISFSQKKIGLDPCRTLLVRFIATVTIIAYYFPALNIPQFTPECPLLYSYERNSRAARPVAHAARSRALSRTTAARLRCMNGI